ncbi:putative glutamate 5-kinase [Mycosarcoma maydis]|uniref:Glutamate 5-kinase n=1 Tax=Mycosarcoma maydis TaxID=5270 RepID=A0A0D1CZS8_MYCMD|nr:putative glutamate 5-kinase [Ustilago maydis 521]KIS71783.1 putative glutamate 5-kinase [Ustilago maydis 521]|eukprot:XP_011386150.1 putative glutamate 5-kinase [Ustilago maydis 521]
MTGSHSVPATGPSHSHHANPPTSAASSSSKTIVIKLGTSSIISEETQLPKIAILSSLVETCHKLRSLGHKVVIVCSGAIGMGRIRMHVNEKPKSLGERQALAALGQLRLIALWDSLFGTVGIDVAQVLLTRNDIADRPRYNNARTTLNTLISAPFNAIPIVNENDTVSVSELRFGDNDTLSAITAGLVDADFLFLCTDVDGLYTGNPRSDPNARRLGVVEDVAAARKAVSVATMGSSFGTGGMQTKLIAAELATAAGVATVIINGEHPENMIKVVAKGIPSIGTESTSLRMDSLASSVSSLASDEKELIGYPPLDSPAHTIFLPKANPLSSRKWSILHALHPAGALIIDEGAFKRIARADSGGRLLPAGVVGVEGNWERMQAIRLVVRRRISKAIPHATGLEQGAPLSNSTPIARSLGQYLLRNDTDSVSGTRTPPVIDSLRKGSVAAASVPSSPSSTAASPADAAAHATTSQSTLTKDGDQDWEWQLIEVGRALANYTSIESERIKGLKSSQISSTLGYADSEYLTDQVALHTLSLPDPYPSQ